YEREGDEDRRQHDAGYGEDDLDAAFAEPWTEISLGSEKQDVDQAGNHRRDGKRQIDQGREKTFALELEFGDRPRGGNAEDEVAEHRNDGHRQREPDRRQGIRFGYRRQVGRNSAQKRLDAYSG